MRIVLLGPPASGKGTVSEKLSEEFGLRHLSTGEILRYESKKNTEEGNKINKLLGKGNLIPDNIMVPLIEKRIKKKDNFILDGFPRTVKQAEALKDVQIDLVLYLHINQQTAVKRVAGRMMCKKCHKSYHLDHIPSKKEGVCDKCGIKLVRRTDDKPEIVKKRFKIYHHKTAPLINYYLKKGILKEIDGSPLPDVVYKKVEKIIKKIQ